MVLRSVWMPSITIIKLQNRWNSNNILSTLVSRGARHKRDAVSRETITRPRTEQKRDGSCGRDIARWSSRTTITRPRTGQKRDGSWTRDSSRTLDRFAWAILKSSRAVKNSYSSCTKSWTAGLRVLHAEAVRIRSANSAESIYRLNGLLWMRLHQYKFYASKDWFTLVRRSNRSIHIRGLLEKNLTSGFSIFI